MIGALLLFFLTCYILDTLLKSKDKDLLEIKFQEYALLLEKDGVAGLQFRILNHNILDRNHFLIRYQSDSGKTLFLHAPESMEIIGRMNTLAELDEFLKVNADKGQWLELSSPRFGDNIEILSKKLPNGDILQIGKDTEDREEFLWQFIESFFIGLIPFVLFSFIIGHLFSQKILSPIRWLTDTVQKIRLGLSGSRVPLVGNKDELDNLGALFNQMQDQNEKLVQGMKETLDNVAHDLRTPVMRMQNAIQFVLKDVGSENHHSRFHNALIECQETSDTILKMLDTIMDISEAETGIMSLNEEELSLYELVENVLNIYRFIGEDKYIEIKNEIPPNLLINGDKGRLLQAFANIVDNAIKFSPDHSCIMIRGLKQDKSVILEITDEGLGIPEHDMPKIWDRLYRGDSSRSTQGLGLGLSFVKAIMNAHKAHIEVENNQIKGCTFRILFPA